MDVVTIYATHTQDPSVPAIFGLESLYRDGKCVGYLRS